ncbi:unnamed protein product [Lampetra fluviatilis]
MERGAERIASPRRGEERESETRSPRSPGRDAGSGQATWLTEKREALKRPRQPSTADNVGGPRGSSRVEQPLGSADGEGDVPAWLKSKRATRGGPLDFPDKTVAHLAGKLR